MFRRSHFRRSLRRWIGAALALGLMTSAAVANAGGRWDYSVRTDFDGKPQMALARVDNGNGSALALSCARAAGPNGAPAALRATILGPTYLGAGATRLRSTIMRFDDAMPDIGLWAYQERYSQLTGKESVKGFVKRLVAAQRVVVELSNYRLETSKVEFTLDRDATRKVVERLERDCLSLARSQD